MEVVVVDDIDESFAKHGVAFRGLEDQVMGCDTIRPCTVSVRSSNRGRVSAVQTRWRNIKNRLPFHHHHPNVSS